MEENKSRGGTVVLAVTLMGLLAASAGVGAYLWTSLEGVEMSVHGWTAMIAGIVLSLVVGVGLMALVFISNRRGYDDRVS
jgi:cation transporter-like permease